MARSFVPAADLQEGGFGWVGVGFFGFVLGGFFLFFFSNQALQLSLDRRFG